MRRPALFRPAWLLCLGLPTLLAVATASSCSSLLDPPDQLYPGAPLPAGDAHVSAATGAGLDALRRLVADRLADRAVSLAADAVVLRPRHEAALRTALTNLDSAQDLLLPRRAERSLSEPELLAADMRAALDALGALAGDSTPDDVLGRVFASFCVGK